MRPDDAKSFDSLKALDAAHADRSRYGLILRGDDGGLAYLTAPAAKISTDDDSLRSLLYYLDKAFNNDRSAAKYSLEQTLNGCLPGIGGKGAVVYDGIWLHSHFGPIEQRTAQGVLGIALANE